MSVLSNVAEGFESGTREKFVNYLYIAKASAGEVRAQLYVALDAGYLNIEMFKYQIVRALIDVQIKDMLGYSDEKLEESGFKSSDEVKNYNLKRSKHVIIGYSPEMKSQRDFLQDLVNEKLYKHFRVERMTSKASRIINDLFKVYKDNPMQLPYAVYPRDRAYSEEEKLKIICNHIALMTDRFALDEHKKLFNPYQKV